MQHLASLSPLMFVFELTHHLLAAALLLCLVNFLQLRKEGDIQFLALSRYERKNPLLVSDLRCTPNLLLSSAADLYL